MPKAKKAARSSATKSSTSSSASSTSSSTPNKSAFVRSLPADMPAKEVVAKAKDKGMVLSENYVYTIRSAANLKKSGRKPGRPAGSKAAPRQTSSNGGGSAEARFVDLALDLGLGNAERLLAKLRSSIKSVTLR